MDAPLSVAVSVVRDGDRVLLIRRERGSYAGMWALPGGKIEADEHLDEAAVREVAEETGIDAVFDEHLGVVSEHLRKGGETENHFLLHVCMLDTATDEIRSTDEGEARWFDVAEIGEMQDAIVASDFRILEEVMRGGFDGCFRCVIDETDDRHSLERFERMV